MIHTQGYSQKKLQSHQALGVTPFAVLHHFFRTVETDSSTFLTFLCRYTVTLTIRFDVDVMTKVHYHQDIIVIV